MAVVLASLSYAASGKSLFVPFAAVGASVVRAHDGAAKEPVDALIGLAFHLVGPSLLWGALYGVFHFFVQPRHARTLLFMGLAIGALAQIVDVTILVPALGSLGLIVDAWTPNVHPFVSWLGHLAYGVGLSLYPWRFDAESGRYV